MEQELYYIENDLAPGFELKMHYHKIMTQTFFVLKGEVEIIFEDKVKVIRMGESISVKPFIKHGAKCVKGGKMLTIIKNGNFKEYVKRLSELSDQDSTNEFFLKSLAERFDIFED